MVSRTFAVNKLNQANKEALNDVKEAKDQYTSLLNEQEKTKANLQSDKSELETKQNDLKSMKEKSDQQQADLNKKIEDNKATLVALQSQYEEAANAVKLAQDKANATAQVADAKKENKNDNKATENKTTSEATSSSNAGSISQGDGSAHGIVAGNTYPWGQCTWYVKQVAPWAGNNWGNGCLLYTSDAADD